MSRTSTWKSFTLQLSGGHFSGIQCPMHLAPGNHCSDFIVMWPPLFYFCFNFKDTVTYGCFPENSLPFCVAQWRPPACICDLLLWRVSLRCTHSTVYSSSLGLQLGRSGVNEAISGPLCGLSHSALPSHTGTWGERKIINTCPVFI